MMDFTDQDNDNNDNNDEHEFINDFLVSHKIGGNNEKVNKNKNKNKTTKLIKNKNLNSINGTKSKINGWEYISIWGNAYDRGFALGMLTAKMFKKVQTMLAFYIPETFGVSWEFLVEDMANDYYDKLSKHYPELMSEIKGIVDGCNHSGITATTEMEILVWNLYISLPYWQSSKSGKHHGKEGGSDHCSVFIATGDYTNDGKIVMAHNSFAEFIDGQFWNVMLFVKPEKGYSFIMQTGPCSIWSGTDVFVTSAGIMGTESTIGGFQVFENNMPLPFRIRECMQYGKTMDDYINILWKNNSGDYANTWYFGDVHTNEIVRFELGLKYKSIDRTKNGYYIGFNATYNPQIRVLECVNTGFDDIRRHQGSRRVRLTDLMDEYKGKIDTETAKTIISDHYDVYLKKENPCSRTVCAHYELDGREYMSQADRPKPFAPHGVLDACITTTEMAKNMELIGKWGASCNIPFYVDKFCKEHRQWAYYKDYLLDRPTQPWTLFNTHKQSVKPSSLKNNKSVKRK